MAFSAPDANGVITQSGRDLDYSGLAGNSGVTITTDAGITYYDFGTNRLVVKGTIFHDPEKEVVIFHHASSSDAVDSKILLVTAPANNWKNTAGYSRDADGNIVVTSTAHGYEVGDAVRFRLVTGSNLEQEKVRIGAVTTDTFTIDNSSYYTLPDSNAGQFNPIGCYNFGKEVTTNGRTRLASGTGIIFSGASVSNWRGQEYAFEIDGFAYMWCRGGTIVTQRPFTFSNYDIKGTKFVSTRSGQAIEVRSMGNGWWRKSTLVNIAGVNVSNAKEMEIGLEGGNITEILGSYYEVSLKDLDVTTNASDYDIGHDGNGTHHHRDYEILNSANGSEVIAMWRDTRGSYGQRGCVATKKEVSLNIKDSDGNAIEGAKIYLQDNPSAYAKDATLTGGTNIGAYTTAPTLLNGTLNVDGTITYNYASPLTYEQTSDASGDVATFKVTTSVQIKEFNANDSSALASNGGPYDIPSFNTYWRESDNSGPAYSDWDTDRFGGFYRVDRRSNDNTSADEFTFKFCSYEHALSQSTQALKGVGELAVNWVLFADASVTETDKSVVDGYLQLETPEKFYDRAKAFLVDNYAGETATIVSRSGNTINAGAYNVTIDASAASAFAFDGSTITIKADQYVGNILSSGTITLLNGAQILGTYGSTTVLPWSVTNVEATSTLQLFNTTTNTEVANLVTGGTMGTKVVASGTYSNSQVSVGDTIRLRLTCQAGVTALAPYEAFGVATSVGISFRADQVDDEIYNSNGIDGSAITTLTADYPNVQIDISDGDGVADARELYAFYVYQSTTTTGIEEWFGAITPIDAANYQVNTAVVDLKLQNVGSTPLIISGARIFRDDNTSVLDASVGDQPMTMDAGNLIQYIQPQIDSAMNANAKLAKVASNTGLIPSLL